MPTPFALKIAIRQLAKRAAITLAAILSLSLGIAATVSVFSLIEHIVLRPFPYRNADRIVELSYREKLEIEYTPVIFREQIRELRKAKSVEELVEMDEHPEPDTTSDVPQDTDVLFLSGNAFQFFGVPALLGRTFLPSDAPDNQSPQAVVVLSYQYWKKRFNSNPEVVGKTLRLGGHPYTVLGVMPRSFTWWDSDVYVPLDEADPSAEGFMTVLRLRPGFNKEQAATEIMPIFQQMRRDHPSLDQTSVELSGINDRFRRSLGKALDFIFAGVVLLLAIACLNVSILLVVNISSRQQEFALRAALGGGIVRVIQPVLMEAGLISAGGALLGMILSRIALPIATTLLPWQLFPNGLHVPLDLRIFLFTGALVASTTVAIALLPAIQASRPELSHLLQSGSKIAGPSRSMQAKYLILISMQIAFATVLVTTTAAAIRGYRDLLSVDLGYDPDHVADFSIPIHVSSYGDLRKRAIYLQELRDWAAKIPGVVSSSLGVIGPPYSDWDFKAEVLGQTHQSSALSNVNFVDSEYFQTLHIALVQGRVWSDAEIARSDRRAIVNEAFVKRVLHGGDVIGRSIRLPDLKSRPPDTLAVSDSTGWTPIIGVVADARNNGLDEPVKPQIYLPYSLYMIDWIQLFVRSKSDPLSLELAVRQGIAGVDGTQQVSSPVVSMSERIMQQPEYARSRLVAALSTVFSVLALLLAGIGIYSGVAYVVEQQKKQFAIRIAFGARRTVIAYQVFAWLTRGIITGILAGVALSLFLRKLIDHWIGRTDGVFIHIAISCFLLLGIAYLACTIPAGKAALAQPMDTLREQ